MSSKSSRGQLVFRLSLLYVWVTRRPFGRLPKSLCDFGDTTPHTLVGGAQTTLTARASVRADRRNDPRARCENNASLALRGPPALSQVRSATRAPPCRRLMKESARVFKGNVRSDDWTRVVRPVAASGRALEEISAAAAPGLRRRREAPNVIHGSGGSCGTPRAQIV